VTSDTFRSSQQSGVWIRYDLLAETPWHCHRTSSCIQPTVDICGGAACNLNHKLTYFEFVSFAASFQDRLWPDYGPSKTVFLE
jgi:hypothetical protein